MMHVYYMRGTSPVLVKPALHLPAFDALPASSCVSADGALQLPCLWMSDVQGSEAALRLRQVLLLFQRQDGVDVCLYCLYMQARPAALPCPSAHHRATAAAMLRVHGSYQSIWTSDYIEVKVA